MGKGSERVDEFSIHVVEVMAGFAAACILTIAFIEKVKWSGYTSLCIFSVALPLLVTSRVLQRHLTKTEQISKKVYGGLAVAGVVSSILGFGLLLLNIFWPSAILFVVTSAGIFWVVLKSTRLPPDLQQFIDSRREQGGQQSQPANTGVRPSGEVEEKKA